MTHAQLASRLGTTTDRVIGVEQSDSRAPRVAYLLRVSAVTGVPLPPALTNSFSRNTRVPAEGSHDTVVRLHPCVTVAEEIRAIASALALRCFPAGRRDRAQCSGFG
jgi:transcriptional regulator with XRE-family HTH domain